LQTYARISKKFNAGWREICQKDVRVDFSDTP